MKFIKKMHSVHNSVYYNGIVFDTSTISSFDDLHKGNRVCMLVCIIGEKKRFIFAEEST